MGVLTRPVISIKNPSRITTRTTPHQTSLLQCRHSYAPVAQLDRVTGFEPVGREFESLRARQIKKSLVEWLFYLAGDGRFELPKGSSTKMSGTF